MDAAWNQNLNYQKFWVRLIDLSLCCQEWGLLSFCFLFFVFREQFLSLTKSKKAFLTGPVDLLLFLLLKIGLSYPVNSQTIIITPTPAVLDITHTAGWSLWRPFCFNLPFSDLFLNFWPKLSLKNKRDRRGIILQKFWF